MWSEAGQRPPDPYSNGEEMVVKERIVVDLIFNDINTCVQTVKAWFVDKGYKKIIARNPDRWSTAVILDIARGGLMSKTTVQATFKSHGGGNSIMIEYVASNDGSGLSGKPAKSMAPDPKDKAYEALAMELSKFVKTTWKRGGGPGLAAPPAPSTMYQTSTPSYSSPAQQQYGSNDAQQYPQYGTYQEQPQTGYDTSGGYAQQEQQTSQEYQQEQPVEQAPEAQPAETYPKPAAEGPMSDEEVAVLETELAREEAEEKAAQQVTPPAVVPGPEPDVELPTPKPIMFDSAEITPPVVEETAYSGPPAAVAPEPEVQPPPEPITPEPILEPKPEIAPVTPEPVPEAQHAPVQPAATPTETFCPGCSKKTKPKWKTCPYCEHDLSGTKTAEPALAVETPKTEPTAQPVAVAPVEQAQSAIPHHEHTVGDVTATCPACPTCGQPPTWIDDYKRYYCYTCQKYL